MNQPHRGYHDLGGLAGPAIDRGEHAAVLWEQRVDALMVLMSGPDHKAFRGDGLRRAIESLGAEAYQSMSYYERWISAISVLLVEKGLLGQEEIDARIRALKERGEGLA